MMEVGLPLCLEYGRQDGCEVTHSELHRVDVLLDDHLVGEYHSCTGSDYPCPCRLRVHQLFLLVLSGRPFSP